MHSLVPQKNPPKRIQTPRMNRTLLLTLALALPALSALAATREAVLASIAAPAPLATPATIASYAGDVTDLVQIRALNQDSAIYDRLWQPFIARWDEKQLLVTYGAHFDGTIDMGVIVCCRSNDNGATWKAPVPVFESRSQAGGVEFAYANSALYHPPGQDIVWCFAMRCPRYYEDSEDSSLCAAYSPDGGRSWHEVELAVHYHSPLITNAGIVATQVGGVTRYLMALNRNTLRHDPRGDRPQFVIESSNLIVWHLAGYVPQEDPPRVALEEGNIAVGDSPGELKMVMRTAEYAAPNWAALDPPVAYSSTSRDGGRTWSRQKPEPHLYNTNSKGFYGCDSKNRHVYVYNDGAVHERRALRYVVQSPAGDWSEPRTFFDGHVREGSVHNSYATLIEDTTPGVFLCVWDSSNQADRIRTSIRFGRLRLDR